MELETFVAKTLKQVIDGVAKAQAHAKDKKAVINPARRITALSPRETRETDYPPLHARMGEFRGKHDSVVR